jgi:hypothetical protein
MLVKVENDTIVDRSYSISKLKAENPNTSFPSKITESTLNSYNAYSVVGVGKPSYDANIQKLALDVSLVDGVWTQVWSILPLSEDKCAANLRVKRDKLLADTDWTQMNDSPLSNEDKTAWATYRQELRDVSDLDTWPNLADEDWPVEP